ncbi:hypothetical protein [Streptomyces sp. NPDC055189]
MRQIVGRLERRRGVVLFARMCREVALTPAGQRLYDRLAPAHREIQEAVAQTPALGKGIAGTLHVASPRSGRATRC